jgi:hypothetical protein
MKFNSIKEAKKAIKAGYVGDIDMTIKENDELANFVKDIPFTVIMVVLGIVIFSFFYSTII